MLLLAWGKLCPWVTEGLSSILVGTGGHPGSSAPPCQYAGLRVAAEWALEPRREDGLG